MGSTTYHSSILTPKTKTIILENKGYLEKIIEYEESKLQWYQENNLRMAWDYGDVSVPPMVLHRLFNEGILVMPFGAGGKTKNYLLSVMMTLKKL